MFVAEGRLAVAALLASSYETLSLLVDDRKAATAAQLIGAAEGAGARVYLAPRAVMAATAGFDLHRGVVAVGRRPRPSPARAVLDAALASAAAGSGRAVVVVAEGLNDHENLGALFRNVAAFGAGGVLLDPHCADPLYRRCVRVSLGHVLRVPFARLAPFPAGLASLRSGGMALVALTPRPGDDVPVIPLAHLASTLGKGSAVALLVGAEGPGLSDAALAEATVRARIPMAPGVDSLNVATAAAVALYALHAAPAGPG